MWVAIEEITCSNVSRTLMEQWAPDYSEHIEELAARIAEPDDTPF
jgi:hypothetical protein